MSPSVHLDSELYEALGRYGNRDESWNDVVARVLEHVDEEAVLEDRNNRVTTYEGQPSDIDESPLSKLEDGTVVRHVYQRGEYSGEVVEATIQGGRINVEGDEGPEDRAIETRTPSGAAREADELVRGDDARGSGYSGWEWWEYQNEDGEWVPIDTLRE